jgi:hypothetical protein
VNTVLKTNTDQLLCTSAVARRLDLELGAGSGGELGPLGDDPIELLGQLPDGGRGLISGLDRRAAQSVQPASAACA